MDRTPPSEGGDPGSTPGGGILNTWKNAGRSATARGGVAEIFSKKLSVTIVYNFNLFF